MVYCTVMSKMAYILAMKVYYYYYSTASSVGLRFDLRDHVLCLAVYLLGAPLGALLCCMSYTTTGCLLILGLQFACEKLELR
jgi:hypothetical protein